MMAHVITFRSARFDVASEPPNSINPIPGESVLRWLRDQLRGRPYETTDPATEDWGWYIDVRADGASYLVGASGDAGEDAAGQVDWTIQIEKHRTLGEKLRGANKLAADDALCALIERLVRHDAGASDVEVERGA
jgi:hypothetical protein